ncbi:TlpA family protein disulfide reductase, partial [Mucilaginibacter conchicola]
KKIALIKEGNILPRWELPAYVGSRNSIFTSDHLKGRIVLIDFWIRGCGYCMESFAHLKKLQKRYGSQILIVSINASDPLSDVVFFYKRENPAYLMLYNGHDLAKQLGVDSHGYPTVLILDKTGKIMYSGNFDNQKIENLLSTALQN